MKLSLLSSVIQSSLEKLGFLLQLDKKMRQLFQGKEMKVSRERDESCAGLREEDDKEVFLATEEERRELIFGSTTGQLETRQPRGVEEFGRFPVSRFKLKKDSGPSKQFYLGTGHKVQIKFHFGADQLLS